MWNKIFFNSQNIIAETSSAVMIKMPSKSRFIGYSFWHPWKLVKEQGGKGYHYAFSFTEDWVFRLKKYGAGRYNSLDVISEMEIDCDKMMDAWGVVNKFVHAYVEQETDKINFRNREEIEIERHIPEKILPLESNIIGALKR